MPVGLVAHHHGQLAVGLEADLAVDDVATGLLELAGPADVGRLVEAGLDLDQCQHLLAGLGGVDEGVDDRRVARCAVEGLLDRQDVRVGGRLLEEPLHRRGERVVGVVQQDVVAPGRLEDVDGRRRLDVGQLAVGDRDEGGVLEVVAGQVGDGVQAAQVERAGDADHLLLRYPELRDQQLQHLRGHRLLDLEADGRAEPAAEQLLLQGHQQVLGVVLLDLEVLVAGHPESVELQHLHAREEPLEVLADDVLQRHEALVAHGHEPAERRRHLDPREVLLVGLGVAHQHGHVERQARDVGERVGGVDGEGGEHGEHPVPEEPLAELLLLAVELVPADQLDPHGRQGGHDLVAEEPRRVASSARRERLQIATSCSRGILPDAALTAMPAAMRRLSPATRTMKNSSRLLVKKASERTRSNRGRLVVLGHLEQAQVEAQPGELPVQEPVLVLRQAGERLGVRRVRRLHVVRLEHSAPSGRTSSAGLCRVMAKVWHRQVNGGWCRRKHSGAPTRGR